MVRWTDCLMGTQGADHEVSESELVSNYTEHRFSFEISLTRWLEIHR